MARDNHLGFRSKRITGQGIPRLGYYLIVTDTEETERNYFSGLKESLPEDIRKNIVIKVISNVKTEELVQRALVEQAKSVQYQNTWIVFDRDKVNKFDSIIKEAKDRDINAGWSNPCFEIWMLAYFGSMKTYLGSVECCNGFAHEYKNKTKKEYSKNLKSIYSDLNRFGNEENAIKLAKTKLKEAEKEGKMPSQTNPATTVHQLIDEIKENMQIKML